MVYEPIQDIHTHRHADRHTDMQTLHYTDIFTVLYINTDLCMLIFYMCLTA